MTGFRKADIVDDFFGTAVADPYRWLEDASAQDTKSFIEAQNERTMAYLRNLPTRPAIAKRLSEIYNYVRYGVPVRAAGEVFYAYNSGLQNQAVWMRETTPAGASVFLDPNALSADGTIAVTNFEPSRDGAWVAYALSQSGSDWQEIHVREVATGKDREDLLQYVKFTSIAWTPDHAGFYYTRFAKPGTVAPEDESKNNKVYYHQLGQSQDDDRLIFAQPEDPELSFHPTVTEDGRYLLLHVWRGTSPKNRLYVKDLTADRDFVQVLTQEDASYHVVANDGTLFYLLTDLGAPRRKLVAVDFFQTQEAKWRTVIPETDAVLADCHDVCGKFVATYAKDACQTVSVLDRDGSVLSQVPLPGVGSVVAMGSRPEDPLVYIQFSSYLYPAQIFAYDVFANTLTPHFKVGRTFDPERYETKQVFYTSKDGTRVPMFITASKHLPLTGQHKTILYGYGGFNVGLTPAFSASVINWLEQGGVWAVANLRGGDEYGETWHEQGMLANKQNVFDDFHSAAEYLIEQGYTSKERLAIQGGSNGGLLVSACMLQRPDLYGAVICQVPVTDMLRYHLFTVGRYWISEYGNAHASKEAFDVLMRYSPLHNVRPGVLYPPMLITTADTDDRVVPAHSFKFTATMQEAAPPDAVIYLRVETKAGHGAGKPIAKVIEEQADICAFLLDQLQ